MLAGATYRISNCGSEVDTQMTIRDLGNNVVGYNDDNGPDCSIFAGPASIDFIPPTDGSYRIQLNRWNCQSVGSLDNGDILVTLLSLPCALPPPISTPSCPIVDVTPDTSNIVSCGTGPGSETLTADYMDLGGTTDYTADLITYDAATFANFAAAATTPILFGTGTEDDRWSNVAFTIPFDFCFYGNDVTQFVVGTNGVISFDPSLANTPSGYSFDENLPSSDEALFENSIYAAYQDLDPSVTGSGTITYGTTSVNGCNALVVLWDNIPLWDNGNLGDNSKRQTVMAVLYENTNIIEILIEEKDLDDDFFGIWNDGNAIVGIQNANATEAVVAPCRNTLDDNWLATNESWRFTPSGASITNLQWLVDGIIEPSYTGQTSITVSPASTTTYTAQITYNLCNGGNLIISDDTTVSVTGGKTWDGSEATNDWMNPFNWSDDAIPTASDCIIIPATGNDPVIYDNDNGDGFNLTIENGAALTLTSDTDANNFASSLTIQDFINIQGTGNLIVEDDASLIQVFDTPSIPNSGNITLFRNTEIRQTDYVYWSSPVQGFDVSNVYGAFTPTNFIYEWTPTTTTPYTGPPPGNVPVIVGNWNAVPSGVMSPGKGYIVRGPTNHTTGVSTTTVEFSGVANNGLLTQPIISGYYDGAPFTYNPNGVDVLTVTGFDDNWNLVGNPYPSALDAQTFLTHPSNSIIEGAVHIWTHGSQIDAYPDSFYDDFVLTYNANDYITYNFSGTNSYPNETFSGKIGSGQGFFVLALNNNETGSIVFNNSMRDRTHRNTDFYRNANTAQNNDSIERHRIWLNLVDNIGNTSNIMVGYIEGATAGKDRLFDAYTREGSTLSMYSKINDERMIIQGRPLPFDVFDEIQLGAILPEPGNYTIAIANVDGLFLETNQPIYLEDLQLGIVHDLRISPYTFTSPEAIDYENRFILKFNNESLSNDDINRNGLTILAPQGKYVNVISTSNPINSIEIIDFLGRTLYYENNINKSEFLLVNHNLSDGPYIVKAILINGVIKDQKIILKN